MADFDATINELIGAGGAAAAAGAPVRVPVVVRVSPRWAELPEGQYPDARRLVDDYRESFEDPEGLRSVPAVPLSNEQFEELERRVFVAYDKVLRGERLEARGGMGRRHLNKLKVNLKETLIAVRRELFATLAEIQRDEFIMAHTRGEISEAEILIRGTTAEEFTAIAEHERKAASGISYRGGIRKAMNIREARAIRARAEAAPLEVRQAEAAAEIAAVNDRAEAAAIALRAETAAGVKTTEAGAAADVAQINVRLAFYESLGTLIRRGGEGVAAGAREVWRVGMTYWKEVLWGSGIFVAGGAAAGSVLLINENWKPKEKKIIASKVRAAGFNVSAPKTLTTKSGRKMTAYVLTGGPKGKTPKTRAPKARRR